MRQQRNPLIFLAFHRSSPSHSVYGRNILLTVFNGVLCLYSYFKTDDFTSIISYFGLFSPAFFFAPLIHFSHTLQYYINFPKKYNYLFVNVRKKTKKIVVG